MQRAETELCVEQSGKIRREGYTECFLNHTSVLWEKPHSTLPPLEHREYRSTV